MTGTVLIVDDSLTVRMNLVDAFGAGDFKTVPCATAAEARRALDTVAVDAIVLDVLLPDADGVTFLAELRAMAAHRDKPVLLLSSEAEVSDRVRGLRTGADAYVGKPYDIGYLVAKTRELMRARQPQQLDAKTLLLIEDDPALRLRLKDHLEAHGYLVLIAASGEDGLRVAADRRPSVIVVDATLAGIDGATVIGRLRLDAALRDIPCLLLTESSDRTSHLDVFGAGADAFVRKDEPIDVILAKLANIGRQSTATAATLETTSLNGPKLVLAVDDSVTYLHEIGASLRTDGYEVALARNGEDALALLAEQNVDCIVLDLKMPGIGGLEACQRIKQTPSMRDIPLIMVSALDKPDSTLAGLAAGADDFLGKSDDLGVLKALVRAQIRRRQFQDENRRQHEELRAKVIEAEADSTRELARSRQNLVEALEWKNHELEAFSYSVAHDLRSPLQIIQGFSEALLDQHADAATEDEDEDTHYLTLIHDAARRMAELVDALLDLARAGRAELAAEDVDLSRLAREVADELQRGEPDRALEFTIEDGLVAYADPHLVRALLANLMGNAWKFTRFTEGARIEVGAKAEHANIVYFVRDNGPGFDAGDSEALFRPFVRLHNHPGISGTGIGLTTVHRVVDRHGGRIWAVGEVGHGAMFLFTLRPPRASSGLPATIQVEAGPGH
jgi:DNA-binding response OmpR family regulator